MHSALSMMAIIAVVAGLTWLTRGLPYLVFSALGGKSRMPAGVTYLGSVLPPAIMVILVIFCLRKTQLSIYPNGLPEGISLLVVMGLQVWRKNSILSILTGTVCYMVLIRILV